MSETKNTQRSQSGVALDRTSSSLIDRARTARALPQRASDRRDNALDTHASFEAVFGPGGFDIIEVGEWWTVVAPEIEALGKRAGVATRLQGGLALDDPPTVIIGGAHCKDLESLGDVVVPLAQLAALRAALLDAGENPAKIEVTDARVCLRCNGHVFSNGHDGNLAVQGKRNTGVTLDVSDACALVTSH